MIPKNCLFSFVTGQKNRCEASSSSQKLVSAMIGTKSSNVTESIFVEFWFSRVNFLHCPAETRLDCNTNLKMHFFRVFD